MSRSRSPQPREAAPIRRATATRPSASGPGDRVASARDIAIYFREDCRPLDDSLQLEMVVAQYVLRIRDVRTTAGAAVGEGVASDVVAELEREADPLSLAILRALAQIGSGPARELSTQAAARLTDRRVGLPPQFADVGNASPVQAMRVRDVQVDDYALFAEFEHPLGRRHTIALFVATRGSHRVKHIGLLGEMDELDLDEAFRPAVPEPLELKPAGALMRERLVRTFGPAGASSDDYRVLIAAARADAMSSGFAAPRVTSY